MNRAPAPAWRQRFIGLLTVLVLIGTSCGGGEEATTTDPAISSTAQTSVTTSTTASSGTTGDDSTTSSVTSTTTASTTTSQPPPPDDEAGLPEGGSPPPGVEDQMSLGGYPLLIRECAVAVNGPGILLPEIVLEDVIVGRLYFGTIEFEDVLEIARPELPDFGSRFDLVVPQPADSLVESPTELPSIEWPEFQEPVFTLPSATEIRDLEVLAKGVICGSGWDGNSFIQLVVTDPDGAEVMEEFTATDSDGLLSSIWVPSPLDRPGRYGVTASSPNHRADTKVDVVPATFKQIRVFGTTSAPPGATFQIGAAGFEPEQDLTLHLYRYDENEQFGRVWRYFGTLDPVLTDDLGAVTFELPTVQDDMPGRYCLIGDGMRYGIPVECTDAGFTLEETSSP